MIAIDTNLLVYAHRSGYPEHESAIRALEKAVSQTPGWGIPLQCIAEFWSIVTHSRMGDRPSTPDEAHRFLANLLEDGQGLTFTPGIGLADRLMQMAASLEVFGPRIFDLQIGLTARDNGAREIWTHDYSFQKLPGLKVVDPL